MRERLTQIDAAAARLALLIADIEDPDSIRRVAESARVAISTVGPYRRYGEPLVAACAAAGTDYVDLTAEPEFVDEMWLRHHEPATRSGARLVHCCGFDSIPHDLGVLYTVSQLPEDTPTRIEGYVRVAGGISGGTYHSAVSIMSRLRQARRVARQRRVREAPPVNRHIHQIAGPPRHDGTAGGWIMPMPTIDPIVVLRSARALPRYGPDFGYGHYFVAGRPWTFAGLAAGVGTVAVLAALPPTRRALLMLKDPGDGPDAQQREKGWFRVRFAGQAAGRRVVTEVSGGDAGYGETSKMLAEAALCLAEDDLPDRAGQLTPAVAMGEPLIGRLQRAGIRFATVTAPSETAV